VFFLYHSLRLTVYLFSLSKYNVIWGYTFKRTNIEPGCVKQEQNRNAKNNVMVKNTRYALLL